MKNVKIIGSGLYLPENNVSNDDLSKFVDTNDEWIKSRTGISNRRISSENNSVLATKAAINALENAKIDKEEIDLIVVATFTPDNLTPSVACLVHEALGMSDNTVAFDINAACSGFVFALEVVSSMMKSGRYKKALVIGSEVISKILDWEDRTTCVLFGDGAGACVLGLTEDAGIIDFYLKSRGDVEKVLIAELPHLDNHFKNDKQIYNEKLVMNGSAVFKFATKVVCDAVGSILENNNLTQDDIAYIVPHQANVRIIDFASRKLKIDKEKFYVNIDKYGNTSAATIPIAFAEMEKEQLFKKGDKIIFVGFGAGLTWGSALIEI